MGREKPRRTGREIAERLAEEYRCGSCKSEPATMRELAPGTWVMGVGHDDGCPVLGGAVDPLPDTFRALDRATA
jgi:ribosomal protein L37AE/L43A